MVDLVRERGASGREEGPGLGLGAGEAGGGAVDLDRGRGRENERGSGEGGGGVGGIAPEVAARPKQNFGNEIEFPRRAP